MYAFASAVVAVGETGLQTLTVHLAPPPKCAPADKLQKSTLKVHTQKVQTDEQADDYVSLIAAGNAEQREQSADVQGTFQAN